MGTRPAHVRERLGVGRVDLGPEQVEVGDRPQDAQIALGLGVVVEVQEDVHVRSGAVPKSVEVGSELLEHVAVDVLVRCVGIAEARRPPAHALCAVVEHVGLERREAAFADFLAQRPDAAQVGDCRWVEVGPRDAPGAAVRPVHPDRIAHLAAQEVVAGHAQGLGLGVQQGVLDGADAHGHDPGHRLPGPGMQACVDAFDIMDPFADHHAGKPLDDGGNADGPLVLVVFAPTHDAVFRGDLDEVVVAPPGVASTVLTITLRAPSTVLTITCSSCSASGWSAIKPQWRGVCPS